MSEQPEQKTTVLVVDDDRLLRRQLHWALVERHRVLEAETRAAAVELLRRERVDVVICDLHLPPDLEGMEEGLAVVEAARGERAAVSVVVITGSDSKRAALEAIRRGAYGFFEKPFDEEEVSHIVAQAARVRRLEGEVLRLRSELKMFRGFGRFVGASTALERVIKQARAVADTNATVLITGENGTGKEVLARAVHEESARRDGPFVAVSCAALPEQLIESELFGHVKGAFTDAKTDRVGRFELANGGTLFLDEIANVPINKQAKLLRVLETGEFERVGSSKTQKVNVRLLSATNADLHAEVAQGKFRQDLLFRLNTVEIRLPPLRDRLEDIPVLAEHFLLIHRERYRRPIVGFTPEALDALRHHLWPGNVRELDHVIERAVLMSAGNVITAFDLALESTPDARLSARLEEMSLEDAERLLIKKALARFEGNANRAAEALGLSRSALYRRLQKYGLGS